MLYSGFYCIAPTSYCGMIRITHYVQGVGFVFLVVPFLEGQQAVIPPSPIQAVPEPPRERLVSPQIAAMLAASMPKYEPAQPVVEKPVEAPPSTNEPVVVMTPVTVIDSNANRAVSNKLQEEKERIAREKFNWKDGGTFFQNERTTLMLKYNPAHKGFDILNIKW
jgi:hypothetical protein